MNEIAPKSRLRLQQIAEHAGVSAATVSRVINGIPGISDATIVQVRRSIESLTRGRVGEQKSNLATTDVSGTRVAFVVQRQAGSFVPAYERLLRGVTAGASRLRIDLNVSFVSDVAAAMAQIAQARYGGLILHGGFGSAEQTRPLHGIPTVWLMGNPVRPDWGDQVMPNNTAIGYLAARYLHDRSHRRVMYVGFSTGWSLDIRMAGFVHAVEVAGGSAITVTTPGVAGGREKGLEVISAEVVRRYLAAEQKPTAIFVAEDWLVRRLFMALRAAGIVPGKDLDVISCNNDRPYLVGVNPVPPTIDIRYERIGERAVEQLAARMTSPEPPNRLRIVVEPALVAGAASRQSVAEPKKLIRL